MRGLLIGAAVLALMAPAAHAQQPSTGRNAAAPSEMSSAGRYLVFFEWDKARLTADGRRVIAEAAEEFKRTGQATLAVTGYTDLSGTPTYNQGLSVRRADAVAAELEAQGVPTSVITTVGEGENNPLVPTADGVREARNRRVEIIIPQPAPVAAAPEPAPMEEAAAEPAKKAFSVTIGPVYGHNFQEADNGSADDDLVGGELVLSGLPGFLGGFSLKQDVFYALNAIDNGVGGRSVISFDLHPNLYFIQPTISINGGGIYGNGVQTGFVVGPEIALAINVLDYFTLRPKVAYDYQFRNKGWDEGILWAGLDLGLSF